MEVPEELKEKIGDIVSSLIWDCLSKIDWKEDPAMTDEDWKVSDSRENMITNEGLHSWNGIQLYIDEELKEGGSLFTKNKSFSKRLEIPIHQYAEEFWKTEVLDITKEYLHYTS